MWKEQLPENCPPNTATEIDAIVYRIIGSQTLTESDFICYARKFEGNKRYSNQCKALAVSFFDSVDNSLKAVSNAKARGVTIGNFIAKLDLKRNYGRADLTATTGHYSVWFYNSWNITHFNILEVISIDAN